MRIRPYLALVRVHLAPTAVADSFTGYCLAVTERGRTPSQSTMLGIAAASTLIYWMGMATNDLLDLSKDRSLHPQRPLPRGEVSRSSALALSALLSAGGLLAAFLTGTAAGVVAAALAFLALLYNAGAKRIPILGNLIMGSCRSANLLLGAAAAIPLGQLFYERQIIIDAAMLGIYMAWITAVSILEDRPPRVVSFLGTTLPILLVPLAVASQSAGSLLPHLNGLALTLLLAAAIYRGLGRIPRSTPSPARARPSIPSVSGPRREEAPGSRASAVEDSPRWIPVTNPETIGDISGTPGRYRSLPHPAEEFVRNGLLGIFLVDAGFLLAADLPRQAAAVWGLMILAWLWRRRWLQSTP